MSKFQKKIRPKQKTNQTLMILLLSLVKQAQCHTPAGSIVSTCFDS